MPSRRRYLAGVTTAGVAAMAGCSAFDNGDRAADAASETTDWPTSRHDALNTGYAPDAAAVRDPTEAWRTEIPMATAPPVAAEGSVFVPAGDQLRVFDAESGEERWRVEEGDGAVFWAPPTVADGVAYLGDGSRRVRAFDAETGERLWRFETRQGVYGAPKLAQGKLFFGTSDERVYALDPATGEERWHRDVFGDVVASVATRPPHVYVTTDAGEVYALSMYGEGEWRRRLPGGIDCPPTVVGDTVYVGCADGRVYALDAYRAGRTRWRTEVGGFPKGLSVARGRVYVVGGRFHAVGADGGRKRWSVLSADSAAGLPAVAGDTVYVGTESGRLRAYRPGGGVGLFGVRLGPSRWVRDLGESVQRGLAVADGRVYAPVRIDEETSAVVALAEK